MVKEKIYFRFLKFSKLIEKSSSLPMLEPIEKRMLDVVTIENFKNERLSVKDMMAKSEISSPTTMHKNIHSMTEKGWIYLEETADSRRRQLQLTKEALKYFDKLGLAIQKSTK
jgi:hypothetical protein